ncbi:MAG: hypothetical protein ACHQNT_11495 [Bacteroidia bacterium]
MKKIIFSACILLAPFDFLLAQANPNEYVETPPELLRNEFSFGVNIHSSGWGIDFRRGKNITVSKKRMWEFEFVGMKHSKEIKSVNPYYENSKSFVFGKLNSVSVLRAAIGMQRVIAGKAERGGVELRLNYTGGLSLGLAKPVYLNIIHDNSNNPEALNLSVEKYNPDLHSIEYIYGRASFTKGLSETKPYPGLYAKLGLSFEYGSSDDDVKIIECGMTVDAYGSTIPIMELPKSIEPPVKNSQVYFNFYINILYGKKW